MKLKQRKNCFKAESATSVRQQMGSYHISIASPENQDWAIKCNS